MQQQLASSREEGDDVDTFGHYVISMLTGPALQSVEAKKMWAFGIHIRTWTCDEKYVTQGCVLRLDYWVKCVAHRNDTAPVLA